MTSEIKKGNKIECYSVSSVAVLKGFIKNGLDSSRLINLIMVFDSNFDEFRRIGLNFPPNLFYYHEVSWSETIGILINEYCFKKEEAKSSLKNLIKNFSLSVIKREESDETYEKLAEEANRRVLERSKNLKLEIGEKDIIIIGGFLKEGITFAHSGDKGFLETCKELKINVIPTPLRDIDKENEIKRKIS